MNTAFSGVEVTGDFDKNSCMEGVAGQWKSLTEVGLGNIVRSEMSKVSTEDAQGISAFLGR